MIPLWQEPSPILLEWALSLRGYHIALHLSNLQKVCLAPCALTDAQARNGTGANILSVTDTRNLYTKLAQGPAKIEEAFRSISGLGLVLWAPEDAAMLTQWLKVWDALHENGICVKLKIMTSFSPFPTCVDPIGILDLWTHPLLYDTPYNSSRISGIGFIKEATNCIFTRFENPNYQTKNICGITLEHGNSGIRPDPISIHIGSGGRANPSSCRLGRDVLHRCPFGRRRPG